MIIGVGGEKQHGKDTVAKYLKEKYGFTQMAFADELKRLCKLMFPDLDFTDEATKESEFYNPIATSFNELLALLKEVEAVYGYTITEEQGHKITHTYLDKMTFSSKRDILQFVGTNILRDLIDPDFHYNTVARPFKQIENGVVSDCRFKNERDNLKKDFRAILIKVVRPSMQKNSFSKHASENSLGSDAEYDHIIINDGTLEDLYDKVDKIMKGETL